MDPMADSVGYRGAYAVADLAVPGAAPGKAAGDGNYATASSVRLYTPEQRARRDASPWTQVQGVLAIAQFCVFLVSLTLVARYLLGGTGLQAATASIICKTLVLYTIMITGSLWEHDVFGQYLFAPAFFWEDVVSFVVLALHTAYLAGLYSGAMAPRHLMLLALAAYATYAVNAGQFLLKLRKARRETVADTSAAPSGALAVAGAR